MLNKVRRNGGLSKLFRDLWYLCARTGGQSIGAVPIMHIPLNDLVNYVGGRSDPNDINTLLDVSLHRQVCGADKCPTWTEWRAENPSVGGAERLMIRAGEADWNGCRSLGTDSPKVRQISN